MTVTTDAPGRLACPPWCTNHYQGTDSFYQHSSDVKAFSGTMAESGDRVDVGAWVERRDYPEGVTEVVGILDVNSLEDVELTPGALYHLGKALQELAFTLARPGNR